MKLKETVYHVRDIEAAIAHYTDKLGGRLVRQLPWGVAFIDMDGQGGLISLFSVETYYLENPQVREFPGPKIILSVEDLDSVRARLVENKVMLGPILGEQGDIRGFEAFDDDCNAIFYLEDPNESVSNSMRAESP
ncbi:MAG: VOC family protein [Fimbriimonadaceae bacterium]